MAPPVTPAPGSIVANRFQLVRELGHGTMGTVWLADHLTLGLRCAVKFMTAEATGDPSYRARFELEARAVARLNSPYIVRVLDYDVYDGVPFIAMEWLHGEDLESRLRRCVRLDPRTTHRIVSQVAVGLTRAHAAGIVHRDLKPGNIFIAEEDGQPIAKLLDFGIAKHPAGSLGGTGSGTQFGTVLGTPAYMSPEQARGTDDIDYRSDLWSLAVIAYECLTGKLPFDGPSLGAIFARIMFEPIPVPSRLVPSLPRSLDAWWERAVSRDVRRRFGCATELATAFGQALRIGGGTIGRGSFPPLHGSVPPPRRRSQLPLALSVLMVALIGLVVPAVRIDPGLARAQIEGHLRSAAQALADPASPFASSRSNAPNGLVAPATGALPHEGRAVFQVESPGATASAPDFAATAAAASSPLKVAPLPTTPAQPEASVRPGASEAANRLTPVPVPTGSDSQVRPPPNASATPSASAASIRPKPSEPPTDSLRVALVGSADPPQEDRPPQGSECEAEQHRCRGTTLQVCNSTLDGWTDVIDCGAAAICDATGEGRCVPSGPQPNPGESPAGNDSTGENPY